MNRMINPIAREYTFEKRARPANVDSDYNNNNSVSSIMYTSYRKPFQGEYPNRRRGSP